MTTNNFGSLRTDIVDALANETRTINAAKFPYPAASVRREIQALRKKGYKIVSKGNNIYVHEVFTEANTQAAV